MSWNLCFLGAVGTVTGSKFLLESDGNCILVDGGLFQGDREWRRRNWDPFPVPPASIDAIVVTHAHLDHCGYLPILVRDGFKGPIVCSAGTARLMAIVLRDAAHLQEEEARWARESGLSRHQDPRPLFDSYDAERALTFVTPTPLGQDHALAGDSSVVLHRAGHILGSCFAAVTVGESRVVFSGDLGRPDHPLLLPPEQPGSADYFVVESTYGNRLHEGRATDELGDARGRRREREDPRALHPRARGGRKHPRVLGACRLGPDGHLAPELARTTKRLRGARRANLGSSARERPAHAARLERCGAPVPGTGECRVSSRERLSRRR